MSAAKMMQVLWGAASPHLTAEELADLNCTEIVSHQLDQVSVLLLRPDEVSSRITDPAILEVGNYPFRGSVQHGHVLIGRLA